MPAIMLIFTLHLPSVMYTSILNILFMLMPQRKMLVSNNYESEHDFDSRREQSIRTEKANPDSYSKMPGM